MTRRSLLTSLLGPLLFSLLLGGAVLFNYPLQAELLFSPRAVDREALASLSSVEKRLEDVHITTPDGVQLHGWFKRPARAKPGKRFPLVIVYGGIRREISGFAEHASGPREWGFLMVNYRGFGLSEGSPSEQTVLADAKLIYDWAAERPDVDPRNIVVLGRSLGSYVAVAVASTRQTRAAILATPFDSFASLGEKHLPHVPLGWLLGAHFDSASLAPQIDVPALFVLAENDDVTPLQNGLNLVRKWGGWTRTVLLRGKSHYGIERDRQFWASVSDFLAKLPRSHSQAAAQSVSQSVSQSVYTGLRG
jgi:pimeloyl-ACP methyl ester carboxylesterase